jgi:hypothetical protein
VPAALLALALCAPDAFAQQTDEALLREGVALRARGRDADALERFSAAWRGARTPRSRGQMGWAAQALGRWRESEAWLREALEATQDPWVVANRTDLERSLRAVGARLGELQLECDVVGARVLVDGEFVGVTPLREGVRLPIGTVNVRVEAEGHIAVLRESVRIRAGEISRERIALTPEPTTRTREVSRDATPAVIDTSSASSVSGVSTASNSAGGTTASNGAGESTRRTPVPPASAARGANVPMGREAHARAPGVQSGVGYSVIGLGAASVIAGGALFLLYESTVRNYSAGVYRGECAGIDQPIEMEPSRGCRSDRESLAWQDPLRWVGVLVGSATIGVGVALLMTDRPRSPIALRCAPWADLSGATCAARF